MNDTFMHPEKKNDMNNKCIFLDKNYRIEISYDILQL